MFELVPDFPTSPPLRGDATTPRVVHRIDSLELVDDLIVAGLGVGLLPLGRTSRRGVTVRPLRDPPVTLRGYAVTRRGRDRWPPLRAVLERLVYG